MNVNSIQQWAGDSFLVFRHHPLRTGTGLLGVTIESAGAGIHTIGHILRVPLEIGG